jgi:Domain of unknown function (DUF4037)
MTADAAGTGQENAHVAWRMAVARRAARVYAGNARLAAFAVAGSVGGGLADRFSDLEIDCYWHEPPADADRLAPIEALGGVLGTLWDFDPDDAEWSEDYQLDGLDVTVSSFTTGTVDGWLDAVTLRADTDPVKHMRLAAIQRCRPLTGAELVSAWRERAGRYPDELVAAMVHRALHPGALPGWAAREALAERGDEIAVQALRAAVTQAVLGALLAINRVYPPHRLPKWQQHLLAGLAVAPDRLAGRLHELACTADPGRALAVAAALLAETAALAERTAGIDLGEFREALAERRRSHTPPVPGLGDPG